MPDTEMNRFLGGSLVSVISRLLVISLIVGAAMVFFNLTPRDLIESARSLTERVLGSGLDGLRTVLLYIAYGAIVVVPIFILIRVLKMTRRH